MAGAQAPTLYHHFGSKQALLERVVGHGFRDYLEQRQTAGHLVVPPSTAATASSPPAAA
ncbi:TetR family transcriptional regulator [Solirubrobacter sp. CPCC 204708]|uniref:TetR family transcriptional regulator n=1 Tax=Solirubrobacter deserti TaxID=2282478 RepID=UPI001930BD49|nr:TetR family transcriptional regulator [Solirubrobacter deserti]